ncbi:MAG: alpha/beta fold hydrolase [Deltaproteobacteria bacterium]|nr:alpha/beta fold hydrolase [Deltaproteobacteria bacterium]
MTVLARLLSASGTLALAIAAIGCGAKSDLYGDAPGTQRDAQPAPSPDAAVPDVAAEADAVIDTPQEDAPAPDADADADAQVPLIAWGPCVEGFQGECATLQVPLDWSQPQGQTIPLYVDRITHNPGATAQLWLLQGGPGGSGQDMVAIATLVLEGDLPSFDIFTLDHRGVGMSARLGCALEPTKPPVAIPGGLHADLLTTWQDCMQEVQSKWGEGLKQFNTTNAARDLAWAIDRTRTPGQQTFVYGVSYGTYWAQRYLQLNPDQPAGVVLDSIVPMDGQFLSQFDLQPDKAASNLADLCKNDSFCASKLGSDPKSKLAAIWAKQQTTPCLPLAEANDVREFAGGALQASFMSPAAFAAMYRLDRCSEQDKTALKTAIELFSSDPGDPGLFSSLLYFNVTFSELWETPAPATSTLLERYQQSLFVVGAYTMHDLDAAWPVYPWDGWVRKYAESKVPMLMLNGTLDTQTPIDTAQLVKPYYSAEHQTFVTIPYANHGTIIEGIQTGQEPCGAHLIIDFVKSPTSPLNTSCTQQTVPPDFSDSSMAPMIFGTADLWENTAGSNFVESAPLTELQKRAIDRIRRRRPVW